MRRLMPQQCAACGPVSILTTRIGYRAARKGLFSDWRAARQRRRDSTLREVVCARRSYLSFFTITPNNPDPAQPRQHKQPAQYKSPPNTTPPTYRPTVFFASPRLLRLVSPDQRAPRPCCLAQRSPVRRSSAPAAQRISSSIETRLRLPKMLRILLLTTTFAFLFAAFSTRAQRDPGHFTRQSIGTCYPHADCTGKGTDLQGTTSGPQRIGTLMRYAQAGDRADPRTSSSSSKAAWVISTSLESKRFARVVSACQGLFDDCSADSTSPTADCSGNCTYIDERGGWAPGFCLSASE